MSGTHLLRTVVAALQARYGPMVVPVTDPFEMILLENAAYLVDDATRIETLARLRKEIGLAPKAILARSAEEIAGAIADGGMKPLMRAEKVLECARIAARQGVRHLRTTVTADPPAAKRLLREYPGAGEPFADKVLLFDGASTGLAPDSNALRVLLRLGFGAEHKSYSASYRAAVSATAGAFTRPHDAQQAHMLLRRHGQEVCKRTTPQCDRCPVRSACRWYGAHRRMIMLSPVRQ